MSRADEVARFKKVGFEKFRELAKNDSLSKYEKIGFPDELRLGREIDIFRDMLAKAPTLRKESARILDIGAGCSDLPAHLLANAKALGQNLVFIDSQEMLDQIEGSHQLNKMPGYFPHDFKSLLEAGPAFDAIIVYSVLQYVLQEGNLFHFLDSAASLLACGGYLLIGDIPNVSKRKRYLISDEGRRFHKEYMQTESEPEVVMNAIEFNEFDDGIVFGILNRYRSFGMETYLLPQPRELPMSNRREDILIWRP